jgi:hypothetical protein
MPPKKDKPKEKPAGWDFDFVEGVILLIVLSSLVTTFVSGMFWYFTSKDLSFYGFGFLGLVDFFRSNIQIFKTVGFLIAGGAAIGSFILTKKTDAIWLAEKAKLYPENMAIPSANTEAPKNPMVERWQKIVEHSESQNQSDWRLAIIEADIILAELLDKLQLPGDTIGEKLKAVEKSDFETIEYAWEAHKARNAIAHEGSNFLLNQHETRHIISLYESVFKEFELI